MVILVEKQTASLTISIWRDFVVVGRKAPVQRILDLLCRDCINGNNTNKKLQETFQKTEAKMVHCRVLSRKEDESHGPEESGR